MPTKVWKVKDTWHAQWGKHGKVYKSKNKMIAKQKANKQAIAIYGSGWRE